MSRRILTYSEITSFQSCRARCEYRYYKNLVPVKTPSYFLFGSAIHKALERWFNPIDFIASNLEARKDDARAAISEYDLETQERIKAEALFDAYVENYPTEDFKVVSVEKVFEHRIRSPKGYASREFDLFGKVDGVIEKAGEHFILEHKTTSSLDQNYLDRVDIDLQILLYAAAVRTDWQIPIKGAVYDILLKPGIRMKTGESEEEFEARRAELLAKSKTGFIHAKRKEPESESEFYDRCRESIKDISFCRKTVYFSEENYDEAQRFLWHISKEIRACEKTNTFHRNTTNCMKFGVPCEYMALCRAGGNVNACPGQYEFKPAHSELFPL